MAKVKLNTQKVRELQVGEIKYKDLISVLEMDNKKSGNSRDAQIRELAQYISIEHIKASKYIINEIYNNPIGKIDNRGGAHNKTEYIELIEDLIIKKLSYSDDGTIFLSKTKLLKELNMINSNYSFCNLRKNKFGLYMEIDESNVSEWFESARGILQRNLESALNNLRNKALIMWSNEITVCKVFTNAIDYNTNKIKIRREQVLDEYEELHDKLIIDNNIEKINTEATIEEKKYILKLEGIALDSMGCKSKQDVIRQNKWDIFMDVINQKLLNEKQILYYYNSYKIIINKDRVDKLFNGSNSITNEEIELNRQIQDRLNKNAINRRKKEEEKCKDLFGEVVGEKAMLRLNDDYMVKHEKITKTLIEYSYKNICNEVKTQKIRK